MNPRANDGGAITWVTHKIQRCRVGLQGFGHLRVVGGLLRVIGRDIQNLSAQSLVRTAKLRQHIDTEIVVDVNDRQALHALVKCVLGSGCALQGIARDGAKEPTTRLALSGQSG